MLREVNKILVFHRTVLFFYLNSFPEGSVDRGSSLRGAKKPKQLAVTGTVPLVWVAR